ncbi:hypothetical protein HanPSC8_Chr10g0440171 [Helianthus annuus]|nr:hypothetical protein HanPSC8_Chr10g0440171 [Helianthus annuus]
MNNNKCSGVNQPDMAHTDQLPNPSILPSLIFQKKKKKKSETVTESQVLYQSGL